MRPIPLIAVTGLLLSLTAPAAVHAAPLPDGFGERHIDIDGVGFRLFTYRPDCRDPSLLLVFHGQNHNADDYRDWARRLADKHCFLVVAPRFGASRFPGWRYQQGGIARGGVLQDPREWTGRFAVAMAERIQQIEGRRMSYSLIGHSAGGQFLSRLAAFTPTQAQRIVIANPGTHVFPDPEVEAPYGFGGIYPRDAVDTQLKRYLAQPITIYLGRDDTESDGLSKRSEALAQGPTRHERGLNAFRNARALAQARGWSFNWRLVEVPGVGHSARKMFAAPEASAALEP